MRHDRVRGLPRTHGRIAPQQTELELVRPSPNELGRDPKLAINRNDLLA